MKIMAIIKRMQVENDESAKNIDFKLEITVRNCT